MNGLFRHLVGITGANVKEIHGPEKKTEQLQVCCLIIVKLAKNASGDKGSLLKRGLKRQ